MPEELVEIDLGPKRVDSTWILLHGRTGLGKTLYMTGIVHACIKYWLKYNGGKILLITNYHIYKLPEGVTVFRSGSVREIMEKMMACEGTGISVIVAIDEINNTLSSKQSATNMSTWLTRVASNARKYGVVAFIFSTQGKKASDYRLRVNCTFFVRPRGDVNIDNHPQAVWWKDSGEWDTDTTMAKRDIFGNPDYQYGVPIPSDFELEYLRDAYNTQEVLPIELDPTVSETEAPILTDRFIEWSKSSQVPLKEMNKSDVMAMVRRWNRSVFVIPYSPAGEQVIYTELLKRGLLRERVKEVSEVKKENLPVLPILPDKQKLIDELVKDPLIAKAYSVELISPGTGKNIIDEASLEEHQSAAHHIGDTAEKFSILNQSHSDSPDSNSGKTEEQVTSDDKKPVSNNSMVEFCCGKLQTNKYLHRKSKKHLKTVNAGVAETAKENESKTT